MHVLLIFGWLGGVTVRVSDLRSGGHDMGSIHSRAAIKLPRTLAFKLPRPIQPSIPPG